MNSKKKKNQQTFGNWVAGEGQIEFNWRKVYESYWSYGKITDGEFNGNGREIKNYEYINSNILNEYNNKGKNLNNDLKL